MDEEDVRGRQMEKPRRSEEEEIGTQQDHGELHEGTELFMVFPGTGPAAEAGSEQAHSDDGDAEQHLADREAGVPAEKDGRQAEDEDGSEGDQQEDESGA